VAAHLAKDKAPDATDIAHDFKIRLRNLYMEEFGGEYKEMQPNRLSGWACYVAAVGVSAHLEPDRE
jgi:hypothetical protein